MGAGKCQDKAPNLHPVDYFTGMALMLSNMYKGEKLFFLNACRFIQNSATFVRLFKILSVNTDPPRVQEAMLLLRYHQAASAARMSSGPFALRLKPFCFPSFCFSPLVICFLRTLDVQAGNILCPLPPPRLLSPSRRGSVDHVHGQKPTRPEVGECHSKCRVPSPARFLLFRGPGWDYETSP